MNDKAATRDSWQIIPMPPSRAELPIDLRLSLDEFERLKRGIIPVVMEDKWFVFHEGGWVYFHRSWTGYCYYQLRFEQDDSDMAVREAWANRDPAQYQGVDIEEDERYIRSVLFELFAIGCEPPWE